MRIRSVDPGLAQSNGEPPTCNNALRQSGAVWASLTMLAPKTGSRIPCSRVPSLPRGGEGQQSLPGMKRPKMLERHELSPADLSVMRQDSV